MDIYKYAARVKLRFPSNRGFLMVEQLFDLPLKRNDAFDLDNVARTINNQLKAITDDSFVEMQATNPEKVELSVALDIVKDVIKTKQDEQQAERARLLKIEQKRKIMDIINMKKDEALSASSIEDLEAKLAELSA